MTEGPVNDMKLRDLIPEFSKRLALPEVVAIVGPILIALTVQAFWLGGDITDALNRIEGNTKDISVNREEIRELKRERSAQAAQLARIEALLEILIRDRDRRHDQRVRPPYSQE